MSLFRPKRFAIPAGERVYAIGDVHGRLDLLTDLMLRICQREETLAPAGLTLVLLGDLIDRGPDSAAVLRLARSLSDALPQVVVLKGNHEEALVDAWRGDPEALAGWLRVGGRETLQSFGVDPGDGGDLAAAHRQLRSAMPEDLIDWLDRRPLMHRCGGYLFVHAGLRPGLPLDRQEPADLLWIRDEFLEHSGAHGTVVVHGHTATDAVDERSNRIGIDTGAYRTGRLTALALEGTTRTVIQTGEPAPACVEGADTTR